jgi:cytochrome b
MTDNLAIPAISVASGALIAAQDLPGAEIADRVGVAAIAVMVVWWMLGSFSKRLDKLTEAIATLTEHVKGSSEVR